MYESLLRKTRSIHHAPTLQLYPMVVSTPVLVPRISHRPILLRRQVIQRFMRPLVVIFHQPALGNFPCFIQCSEQVKIQDFCPVCPVEPFDKSILCRLTRLDKFELYDMFFGPLIVPAPARPILARCPSVFSPGSRGLPRSCPEPG